MASLPPRMRIGALRDLFGASAMLVSYWACCLRSTAADASRRSAFADNGVEFEKMFKALKAQHKGISPTPEYVIRQIASEARCGSNAKRAWSHGGAHLRV